MDRPFSSMRDVAEHEFAVELRHESVVVCRGELDLAAVPDLRGALEAAARHHGENVIIDLRDVTFFDCSAIGEFVRARSALRSHGNVLSVRGLAPSGRRLLDLVGLDLTEEPQLERLVGSAELWPPSTAAIDEMVVAWRSDCLVGPVRSNSLLFTDPSAMISRIAAALIGPGPSTPPAVLAELVESCPSIADADPAAVVMQLIALSGVMHTWVAACPAASHLTERLDAIIGALVAATVDALVDIGLVDPLTGLRNRRALDHDLVQFLAAARRREQCLMVVMIDVEGLKAVNDRLGHAAGDDLLKGVATSLIATLRAGDHVYRIGGDEFVLVLPDLGPDHVDAMMRRTYDGTDRPFTWGCAWLQGDDATGSDRERATALLELADRRMLEYRSRPRRDLAGQIASGGRDSALIEEATGMLAQRSSGPIADAAELLRSMAQQRGETLDVTARLVVSGTIEPDAHRGIAVPSDETATRSAELSGTTGGPHGS